MSSGPIGYLQDTFPAGRSFADLASSQAQGRAWLDPAASVRVRATMGRRHVDLLAKEGLTPLAKVRPCLLGRSGVRGVSAEGLVHLDRSTYSVPPEHVGATVQVEEGELQIRIRCGAPVLAERRRPVRPGQQIVTPECAAAL